MVALTRRNERTRSLECESNDRLTTQAKSNECLTKRFRCSTMIFQLALISMISYYLYDSVKKKTKENVEALYECLKMKTGYV